MLLEIGSEPLRPLLRPIATTLRVNAGDLGGPGIAELWDTTLDIAIREGTADVDGDALAEQATTNPIGDLARALIHAQDVRKGEQDGGFDPLVAPRLDALVGSPSRLASSHGPRCASSWPSFPTMRPVGSERNSIPPSSPATTSRST